MHFGSLSYAKTSSELLQGYSVVKCESRDKKNGVPIYSYYVFRLPFTKNDDAFDIESASFKLSENVYATYSLSYTREDGEIESYEPAVGYGEDGLLMLRLNDRLPDGAVYTLSVIETTVDENGNVVDEKVGASVQGTFDSARVSKIKEPKKTSWISAGWAALHGDLSKVGKILVETFCDVLVALGDAFLDMICNAVGEVVTIDGVVYNRVSKVDIDFFSDAKTDINSSGVELRTPLKTIMGTVIDKVYVFFRNIVIVFYMVMLVYIGIRILYTSTGEKNAGYKSMFMAWVTGIMMLMFFPYVMKYSIQLNSAICQMIGETGGRSFPPKAVNKLAVGLYGDKHEFVKYMLLDGETVNDNAMLHVRYIGAINWNIPLIIVYYIFIGQLLAILIMYYRRVFMLAFLIAIFPIVVLIYPLRRMGAVGMNTFGEWFKEFLVNVFVQSFHAATYRVIVSIGVSAYTQNGNWLFMIMCILFLFEGEKIIRAIFNVKSGANTIGNMAVSGAIAMKMVQKIGSTIPSGSKKEKEDGNKKETAEEKAKKDLNQHTETHAANRNKNTINALEGGDTSRTETSTRTASSSSRTTSTVTEVKPENSSEKKTETNGSTTLPSLDKKVEEKMRERKGKMFTNPIAKVAGTGFNIGSQLTGSIVGSTFGLAQSNSSKGIESAIAGYASGRAVGKNIGTKGKEAIVEGANRRRATAIVARQIHNGELDEELGISEADKEIDSARDRAIRKAYEKYIKRSRGMQGKDAARLSFYQSQFKILNESVDRKQDKD